MEGRRKPWKGPAVAPSLCKLIERKRSGHKFCHQLLLKVLLLSLLGQIVKYSLKYPTIAQNLNSLYFFALAASASFNFRFWKIKL